MPKMNLTDAAVKRLPPPPSGQVDYFDISLPGLALRLSHQGARAWTFNYSFGDKRRRVTLGRYPALSLHDARGAALEMRQQVGDGIDPAREKKIKKQALIENPDNFEAVAALFIARYAKKEKNHGKPTSACLSAALILIGDTVRLQVLPAPMSPCFWITLRTTTVPSWRTGC